MKKKLLSVFLVLTMVLGMLPMTAFAEEAKKVAYDSVCVEHEHTEKCITCSHGAEHNPNCYKNTEGKWVKCDKENHYEGKQHQFVLGDGCWHVIALADTVWGKIVAIIDILLGNNTFYYYQPANKEAEPSCGHTHTDECYGCNKPGEGHTWNTTGTVQKEATCTEKGTMAYFCRVCGNYYTEDIEVIPHDWSDATCTEPKTCKRDGCTATEGEKLGHDYQAVVTKPTCEDGGYTTYTCSRCKDSYVGDETTAPGHNYPEEWTDCKDGENHEKVCANDPTHIVTEGHKWDNGVIDPEATCEDDGVKTFTCESCGATKTEPVASTDHEYEAVVTAPTCTVDGYTTYTCACGDTYTDDVVPATAHKWDDGKFTEPTCTTDGFMTHECLNEGCKASYEVTEHEIHTEECYIDCKGGSDETHTHSPECYVAEWNHTILLDGWFTCPADVTGYCWYCSRNLPKFNGEQMVQAYFPGTLVDLAPEWLTERLHYHPLFPVANDCTFEGKHTHTDACGKCAWDARGHVEGEAVVENEVAATCTTDGSYDTVVYCSVCDEELSREANTVDALDHEWGEWQLMPNGYYLKVCARNSAHSQQAYRITYDANGGVGEPPVDETYYKMTDTAEVKDANGMTKEKAVFLGYSKTKTELIESQEAEEAVNIVTSISFMNNNNTTLYAVWAVDMDGDGTPDYKDEQQKYAIVYAPGAAGEEAANLPETEYVVATTTQKLTTVDPTWAKHVFWGWLVPEGVTIDDNFEYVMPKQDITFVAQWKVDRNENGTPDEMEYVTVTYTDGVTGAVIFADDIHTELLIGDATPAFRGNTVRSGFIFQGWAPAVTDKVTGTTTYVAQWKAEREYDPIAPNVPSAADVNVKYLNTADHLAYIIGYADGTIKPQGEITRAEIATIYFRLMDDETRENFWSTENGFADVNENNWFNLAVSTLNNAGVIVDVEDGNFRPNDPITRAELAVMAAQFCTVTGKLPNAIFADVDKDYWAAEEIALIKYAGWIEGYPDGSFRPDNTITRAEAMTIINRMLGRAVEEEGMLEGMLTFVDVPVNAWYFEAVQEATNSHDYVRTDAEVEDYGYNYEIWTVLLESPDWAAIEKSWIEAR